MTSSADKTAIARERITQLYKTHFGNQTGTNTEYQATGPVRQLLDQFNPSILCEHAIAATAVAFTRAPALINYVVWTAWKPEYLECESCFNANKARYSLEGDEENYRCDYCRNLSDIIAICTSILNTVRPGLPPVVCMYGICQKCKRASGM